MTIKGTEKYIEASGCYSDWENRKQIRDNTEGFSSPKEAEESLIVALFGFKAALKDTPPFLQEELKSEFCSWVDATGIDINNCRDERLKHILFEINEIIKGEGDRLAKESALWAHEGVKKMSDEEFSKKMNEGFIGIQSPLNSERKVAKSLVGKTYKDVESEKIFNGNSEKGEWSLDLIVRDVANKHGDFHFFKQKTQQIRNPNYNPLIDDPSEEFLSSSSSQSNNPYVEVGNERELSPEQLGTVQQVNQELSQVTNVPTNELIPVASGGLAFMIGLVGGIRWFRKKNY